MRQFKEMGITAERKSFVGDKIKLERLLNREIIIHDFEIKESKIKDKGTGKCLYLQIEIKNEKHVVFSGSAYLMDMITQVPDNGFPFETTIVKINDHFEFT
jgi:hypothetical protein